MNFPAKEVLMNYFGHNAWRLMAYKKPWDSRVPDGEDFSSSVNETKSLSFDKEISAEDDLEELVLTKKDGVETRKKRMFEKGLRA